TEVHRLEPVGQAVLFRHCQAARAGGEVEREVAALHHRLLDAVKRAVVRQIAATRHTKAEREGEYRGKRGTAANGHRAHLSHLRLKPGVAAAARCSLAPCAWRSSAASAASGWSARPTWGWGASSAARGIGRVSPG